MDPVSAVLHHNLGNVLRVLDRLAEARTSYIESLRWDPDLALANAHLGLVMQREGQLIPALSWLRKAVELEPANAMFWEWLAELNDEREEPAEAIPCWQHVLVLEQESRPDTSLVGLGLTTGRTPERRPRALPDGNPAPA